MAFLSRVSAISCGAAGSMMKLVRWKTHCPAMRILLQQKNTGLYFKESGVWTASAAEATDFLSSTKAIAFCASKRISGVQLVLKFDEEHYDIVMPMLTSRREQHAHA